MMSDLRTRLRGLRRGPSAGSAGILGFAADTVASIGPDPPRPPAIGAAATGARPRSDLERLEGALVGAPADGLSLKARLERLVAAASRGRAGARRAVPLEEVVVGRAEENDRGEFFLVEDDRHLESRHGDVPLSRFRALVPGTVSVLAGEPDLRSFDLRRAVFLDTETTGLAGGTGTAAFLIGIGFVAGDRFLVRQYLMRDYHEEAALLHGLAAELSAFSYVVTYNGKAFDLPLLESRYRLNRERFPLAAAQHLDLLPPARRLWKLRLESCRLQSLELALLGVRRSGDVPGEEIPRIYFDYVRSRDARALARVLDHNRADVVSLAALSVLACQWVEDEDRAEDPRDVYCLGRVLERAQLYERSEAQYRRAAREDAGRVRLASLLRLAARAKKAGDHGAACALWKQAAEAGSWWALRELAVYHEHRSRDLGAALAAVDRGLHDERRAQEPGSLRATADFERRHARLARKMASHIIRGARGLEGT